MEKSNSDHAQTLVPNFNRRLFWISLVLPTLVVVIGFLFAELVEMLGGAPARMWLESILGPIWALALAIMVVACPLICAAQCVKFLKTGIGKFVCGFFLSGLLVIVNVVVGVSTCAAFITPNFH